MAEVYCNYGVVNKETGQCFEEGDTIESLTFYDCSGNKTNLKDAYVYDISSDNITVISESGQMRIEIRDIVSWE